MKKVTKWIAEDGTEFESEWECQRYERNNNLSKLRGCKAFDDDGYPIDIEKCESAFYIYFKEVSQIKDYNTLLVEQGMVATIDKYDSTKPLCFWYKDDELWDGEWVQISELYDHYEGKIRELDSVMDSLFGVAAE